MNVARTHRFLSSVVVVFMIVGLVLSACATPQPKTYTIGLINPAAILNPVLDGFKARMTELGYT